MDRGEAVREFYRRQGEQREWERIKALLEVDDYIYEEEKKYFIELIEGNK